MVSKNRNQSIAFGLLMACTVVFLFAFVSYAYAFQEPTQAAPQGNVSAPINVGTDAQYKTGYLSIGKNTIPTTSALEIEGSTGKIGVYAHSDSLFGVYGISNSGVAIAGESTSNVGVLAQSTSNDAVAAGGGRYGVNAATSIANLSSMNSGDSVSAVKGEASKARFTQGELAAVEIYDPNDINNSVSYGLRGYGDVGAAAYSNSDNWSLAGYLAYRDSAGYQFGSWGFGMNAGGLIGVGVRGQGGTFGGIFTGDNTGLYAESNLTEDIFKGNAHITGVTAKSRYQGVYASDGHDDYQGVLAVRDIASDFNDPLGKDNSYLDPFYYGVIGQIKESNGGNNVEGRSAAVMGDYVAYNNNYARGAIGFKDRLTAFGPSDYYYGGYYDVSVGADTQVDPELNQNVYNHAIGLYANAEGTTDAIGVKGVGTARGVYGESVTGHAVEGYSNQAYGVYGQGGSYGTYGTGSLIGVFGESTSGYAVAGLSTDNSGVRGVSSNADGVSGLSSTKNGVYGEGSTGVKGVSSTGDGVFGSGATGVFGYSTASGGFGVKGNGPQVGVEGISENGNGVYARSVNGDALYSSSTYGTAVNAYASNGNGIYSNAPNGVGVQGQSLASFGVYGYSKSSVGIYGASTNGVGMYGMSINDKGVYGYSSTSNGMYGHSDGSTSAGVYGYNGQIGASPIVTTNPQGLHGKADGAQGIGVLGEATAEGGRGVWGIAPDSGFAGYFDGYVGINKDAIISGDIIGGSSISVSDNVSVGSDLSAENNLWGSTQNSGNTWLNLISGSLQENSISCYDGEYVTGLTLRYMDNGNPRLGAELNCTKL